MQHHVNAHPVQRFNCEREQEIDVRQVRDSLIAPTTRPNGEDNSVNTDEKLSKKSLDISNVTNRSEAGKCEGSSQSSNCIETKRQTGDSMEETKDITLDATTTGLETKAPSKPINSSSDLMAVEPHIPTSLHRHAENRPLDGKGKQHFY